MRRSDRALPPGWLQYSTISRAASVPRVPRLMAIIIEEPALSSQSWNSPMPMVLGSVVNQAMSSRRGRSATGPTESSQLKPETKLPPG